MKNRVYFISELILGALMLGLSMAGPSSAQSLGPDAVYDTGLEPVAETKASIGLGLGAVPDYEGSDDYQAVPVPFVNVNFANDMSIHWIANTIRANILPTPVWKAGPMLQYLPKRDDVDDNKVDKLTTVDASLMMGGFFGINLDRWNASIEATKDVADGNDGTLVRLRGGYKIPIDRTWNVSLNAFTTWADNDYMDAYFGISRKDSEKSGLDKFNTDACFKDFGGILSVFYSPWQNWSLMGVGVYKRLIDDAKNSPVTDDRGDANQYLGGLLVIYNF